MLFKSCGWKGGDVFVDEKNLDEVIRPFAPDSGKKSEENESFYACNLSSFTPSAYSTL